MVVLTVHEVSIVQDEELTIATSHVTISTTLTLSIVFFSAENGGYK